MLLIAGGTGRLGTQVVRLLTARGRAVRVLTRDPARARHLQGPLVEVASGDVRNRPAVDRAMAGVRTVISAVHGFAGTDNVSPQTVDRQGNHHLIQAARAGAAEHVVLVSIQGAAPDHPMKLFRMKYLAEQELQASRLAWTILCPTAYMETWASLIGAPLLESGKARLFGRGDNPINFVSVHDVARFVELAVVDPALRDVVVEVGGPENLSMEQVVQTFETVTGKTGTTSHVPLPVMRLLSVVMRPLNASLARQIQAGVVMDTRDMTFDASPLRRRFPSIPLTSLADVVRRDYVDGT